MRRLAITFAALAAAVALTPTADALARDGGRDRGAERGSERGRERSAPPAWAGGGRGAPGPAWREPQQDQRSYPARPYTLRPDDLAVRRGGFLPPDERGDVIEDLGRYHLRPPPRGHAWVHSGGATVLMDLRTGQVFDVIPD